MPDHDATDQLLSHGAGPGLVVLLHAAGSGPRGLDRLARQLAASGWRTAAPLLERGGDSLVAPPPHGGDAFAAVTGLVRRLLDGGAGPRVLLGHSMGGHAVLRALADGIEAQAAILYEPIALALLDPADPTDSPLLAADAACITAFREAVAAGNPEPGLRGFIEAYGEHAWGELPPAVRADLLARASALLAAATATNAAPIEP
ncbi:MAG: alpha/beta hydrolase, partial [Hyphomicrobiaceae bacterium]